MLGCMIRHQDGLHDLWGHGDGRVYCDIYDRVPRLLVLLSVSRSVYALLHYGNMVDGWISVCDLAELGVR